MKHSSNNLLASNSDVAVVGGPHVSILVANHGGLRRVWLDTAKVETVDDTPDVFIIDDGSYIVAEKDRYIIKRGTDRIVVKDVAPKNRPVISRDNRAFAVEQPDDEIAIVSVADGSVHRISLGVRATNRWGTQLRFAKDNSLLVSDNEEVVRIDIPTGARTKLDRLDWKIAEVPPATECHAKGLRLEKRTSKKQQTIVLVGLASPSNPEQLTALNDRVLVTSTNYPDPCNSRSCYLDPAPGALEARQFTPDCNHFVFTLEDRVYLGNVATGTYAFLMRGAPVTPNR